ncbi:LOW QUALITY PROTEIN: G-type lectin S-receptor-like serine/threonine-protein kinase At5g35370 [Asparagus officinalis]|uniref:LOW QUALITY PROTEIN: G-type lectin S-receptor-like serine/threonine-protein kinase At5g35370 n=1 Tax=Asparagus officinalis TaxID=4686 RepID=UPI00098DF3F2|nr:LOW QUALITY PROTEIN: G-type lectin S-receptor-like serine/threonine-protein kinase At5g35370 [Asparagus officinalis]
MRWKYSQQYWSLSTDLRSFKDHNAAQVDFMVINSTGLHLISKNEQLVYQVFLPSSDFRVLKLDAEGRLHIKSYSSNTSSSWTLVNEFIAPSNDCELPFTCNALGVCSALSGGSNCTCPARFTASSHLKCSPADVSYIVASSALCPSDLSTSYLSLGTEIKYFANKFAYPTSIGSDIEACEELCTGQCHCLGFSYRNSSRSCYLIEYYLGSFSISSTSDPINTNVYIKTFVNNTSVSSENMRNARKKNNMTILLSSSTAGFVLIVITLLLFIRLQRSESDKKKNEVYFGWLKSLSSTSKPSNELEEISIPGLPTRFTYDEVVDTTDDFRTKIGSGGFGNIYKGELPDKTQVAIKRMSDTASSMQGKKEYVTEIATIGSIHHHNLVRLYGFCAEKNHRILVYEYMNRGSLDQSLFRPGPVLGWTERLNIAIGTARGLAYLHSGCQHKIVHCDIKPENILLDEREGIKRVKISDFGLAKLLSRESMETFFSTMRGTRGYLAPEWLTNTGISDKSDVYSFGMVLLEIVRGRKSRSQDIEYVLEMHEKRKYMELPDGRLEGRATAAEVERVVKVALWCLQEEPWMRPSMGSVVAMLEGTVEVEEPMLESLGFLRLYSKGFEGAMAMTMG